MFRGGAGRIRRLGFAVPLSNPRLVWRKGALCVS
jgi:hypothetical protein